MISVDWLSVTWGLGVVSAVMPWFNAEVILFSAAAGASSKRQLLLLVLGITAGQVVGKAVMYWGARRASATPAPPRIQQFLDRWRARFDARPSSAPALVFVSAAVGFPPPYVVTIAAGTLQVAFWPFVAATGAGRLLHFGLLALIPAIYLLG